MSKGQRIPTSHPEPDRVARFLALIVGVTAGSLLLYGIFARLSTQFVLIELAYAVVIALASSIVIRVRGANAGVAVLVFGIQLLLLVEPYLLQTDAIRLSTYFLCAGVGSMALFSVSGLFLPRKAIIILVAATMVDFGVVLYATGIGHFRRMIPFVVGAVFVGGILILYFHRVAEAHRRKATIEARNARAAEQYTRQMLEEKTTFLREVHHRVKNNLQIVSSLLSLQAESVPDPAIQEAMHAVRGRVNAMALVHDTLKSSETASTASIRTFAGALIAGIRRIHPDRTDISVSLDAEDVQVDTAKLVSIGLILNELTENSYEHAFPHGREGEITISIHDGNASLTLDYRDNGIGLPGDGAPEDSGSLGLTLVSQMATQLSGTLTRECADHGMHWSLVIPQN